MFSMYLGYEGHMGNQQSMIWFGGYDTSFIKRNFRGYQAFSNVQIH